MGDTVNIIVGNYRDSVNWSDTATILKWATGQTFDLDRYFEEVVGHVSKDAYRHIFASNGNVIKVSYPRVYKKVCGIVKYETSKALSRAERYNLVFSPTGERMPENNRCKSFIFLSPKVMLVSQNLGMPIDKYIFWYKREAYKVLAEWSGVPVKEQKRVYKLLMKFILKEISGTDTDIDTKAE